MIWSKIQPLKPNNPLENQSGARAARTCLKNNIKKIITLNFSRNKHFKKLHTVKTSNEISIVETKYLKYKNIYNYKNR